MEVEFGPGFTVEELSVIYYALVVALRKMDREKKLWIRESSEEVFQTAASAHASAILGIREWLTRTGVDIEQLVKEIKK